MPSWSDEDSTRAFDGRAELDERGRPGYPEEAVELSIAGLGPAERLRVVDVASGTGQLARLFAAKGCRVVAVEPNADMRAAAPRVDGLSWSSGRAEETGTSPCTTSVSSLHEKKVPDTFSWIRRRRSALPARGR